MMTTDPQSPAASTHARSQGPRRCFVSSVPVEGLRQAGPDVRVGSESPQQGAERGRISVAHLRRDLLDALARRAQQVDGALGPQTLHERERAYPERSLGPSLEGAPAGTDRRRKFPDIERLAQAGAGLLLEGKYQPIAAGPRCPPTPCGGPRPPPR
jgi:hypothetical protein